MVSYPDVNGIRYDFSSVEININGTTVLGVKSISYKHDLKPGKVRGTSAQVNGRTRGQYEPEASLTMYKAEADELRAALGDGYMETAFPIVVHYADTGQPVRSVKIVGARIAGESDEHEEGTDALVTKFDLDVIAVIKDGLNPIKGLNV